MSTLPITDRSKIRRLPSRGEYDVEVIRAIIDDALICHLGTNRHGAPMVMPTACWRIGDYVYFHGAPASRTLKASAVKPVCLTVTHIDGLVMARSAFHHSVNYRSVLIFGQPETVAEGDKEAVLRAFVDHVAPGRWEGLRPITAKELKGTAVLRLAISEASAKIRTGPPVDDDEDYALPIWAGLVPITLTKGEAVSDPKLNQGVGVPEGLVETCWPRLAGELLWRVVHSVLG